MINRNKRQFERSTWVHQVLGEVQQRWILGRGAMGKGRDNATEEECQQCLVCKNIFPWESWVQCCQLTDTLSQGVGKDSNSVPVPYLSTGLCGLLQIHISLSHYTEQVVPEQMVIWSIAMQNNWCKLTSFILRLVWRPFDKDWNFSLFF